MSLFHAILIAIWVVWAIIDEQTFQFQTTRPIITGTVVGLILGDLTTGLIVGATVELMFLAVVFVGTAVPPDPTLSAAIATAFAVLAGSRGIDVAVATALPIALIGQVITTLQFSIVNVFFMHRAEKAAEKLDSKGIINNNLYALAMNIVFYGLPTFLAVYYGADYVIPLIDSIPERIISGIAVGGGMIGAVGFALLLTTIKAKKLWAYFLIGFIAAVYLNINMLGIGLIAVIATSLHNYLSSSQKEV